MLALVRASSTPASTGGSGPLVIEGIISVLVPKELHNLGVRAKTVSRNSEDLVEE